MRLNRFETALMNNPMRAWLQRHFEARRLLRLGGQTGGGTCLEIGCGRGIGVGIILGTFGAGRVHAFDLDTHMIELAAGELRPMPGGVMLSVGDTTAIAAGEGRYDAVFDFGALHHVVDWRRAVREVFRVLKPEGRFYAEEVPAALITHPLLRWMMDHPRQDRFSRGEFAAALDAAGFRDIRTDHLLELFAWSVARKPSTAN
jgi:ubiquinone/menaquinone biosynthesis C-methylase UbiE